MSRPPQSTRQTAFPDQPAPARHAAGHARHESAQARPAAAPPRHTPPAPPQAVQPKAHVAPPPSAAGLRGAGTPHGIIQANVIGGTRALQARLVAAHAAAHRETAARVAGQSRPAAASSPRSAPAAARDAAQAVQCKSSYGVDAFRVSLQPKSGGQPLPSEVRTKMETAFGADFSDVRVHVGHEASRIGAIAYTWGSNIHFAPGHYNPTTLQGQKVLGHELWHVVQQKSGRVQNPFGNGVAVVQDHALEAEADRMGLKAALTTVMHRPGSE